MFVIIVYNANICSYTISIVYNFKIKIKNCNKWQLVFLDYKWIEWSWRRFAILQYNNKVTNHPPLWQSFLPKFCAFSKRSFTFIPFSYSKTNPLRVSYSYFTSFVPQICLCLIHKDKIVQFYSIKYNSHFINFWLFNK